MNEAEELENMTHEDIINGAKQLQREKLMKTLERHSEYYKKQNEDLDALADSMIDEMFKE